MPGRFWKLKKSAKKKPPDEVNQGKNRHPFGAEPDFRGI